MSKFKIGKAWKNNALEILEDNIQKELIVNTLFAILQQIETNDWKGACHATCGVAHVLLTEQGVSNSIVIGEAKIGLSYFNHSWITIDNCIYDLAVANSLVPEYSLPPTIKGFNMDTKSRSSIDYGVNSGLDDDQPTAFIKQRSLTAYFDSFPYHSLGLWASVLDAAYKLKLKLNINELKTKYSNTNWSQVTDKT